MLKSWIIKATLAKSLCVKMFYMDFLMEIFHFLQDKYARKK